MKRVLLLLSVCSMVMTAMAQRTLTGRVMDGEANEAVIQATVALLKTDSTLSTSTVTDIDGNFKMTAPADGRFIVRITYVGYKTFYKNTTVQGKPVNLGTLTINPDSKMLKEVEVVKNMAKVYSKEDTLIYNAGAYKTPEGSVIEELVKRLPGAEVTDDGKITINGKEVKKIKVDGKEFLTGDTQTAIKNLPTSIVERVKAYDEKSDQARITGIDDGNDQTVLDFGLKKGMNQGSFANVDAGIGTKSRYTGRLMGMRFKDGLRVMGFANANNVGDRGFGGRGGGGLRAPKMAALNLNYEQKDRLKIDGGIRWNHNNTDSWSRTATENFVSRAGAFSNSVSQSYSRSNSWNGNLRIEWTPDTLWNIHFRPTWNYNSNDSKSQSISAAFRQDPYNYVDYALNTRSGIQQAITLMRAAQWADDSLVVNSRDNASLSYSDNKSFGGELQINRKLGGGGRNIALRLSGNYSDGDSKSLSLQDVDLYQVTNYLYGDSTYMKNRYNLTPSKNYNYGARLTYSEPIIQQTYLQFSYDFQYRYTKSDRSTYDFSEWPTRPHYIGGDYPLDQFNLAYRDWETPLSMLIESPDSTMADYKDDYYSRFSEYKNFIHTAEIMLRVVRKSYNFNVGVQVIPQTTKFSYRYQDVDYGTTTRTVVNWSPTANFRWKLSDQGQMRFTYRGSTSQPSMTDLLAITDDSDPLNITIGNAGLKPSFTQNFNWRFNNYYQHRQQFIFANFGFQTTRNAVTSKVSYNPLTGGRTSTRDNINGNWSTNGEFMYNTAIDTLGRFNINTRTTARYTHSVSYLDAYSVSNNKADMGNLLKNAVNETVLGERLGTSFRNDWLEVELNGAVNYTFGRNKLQSNGNQDTWNFSYGLNTTAQLPWGMQLTTGLNMQSRRGYSDASMNTNELIWNAQIAQSFLKGKPLSVRLEFYDILGQQSNFTRTLNAMMRSDSESNAINSYVMLRVNYRLNLFGTKEARQEMRHGPGGERDGFGGERGNRGTRGGGGRGGFGGGGGFGGPRF